MWIYSFLIVFQILHLNLQYVLCTIHIGDLGGGFEVLVQSNFVVTHTNIKGLPLTGTLKQIEEYMLSWLIGVLASLMFPEVGGLLHYKAMDVSSVKQVSNVKQVYDIIDKFEPREYNNKLMKSLLSNSRPKISDVKFETPYNLNEVGQELKLIK